VKTSRWKKKEFNFCVFRRLVAMSSQQVCRLAKAC